jgi:hypothetical protein
MSEKNFTIGVLVEYIGGLIRGNTPIRDEYEKGYVDACERIAEVIRENFTQLPSEEFKPDWACEEAEARHRMEVRKQ